ncbi:MAG: hypothetical protein Q8930_10580 [Bacillota bacterium]|nr:hypothetical protein [Bacillota bacterium]
MLKLFTALVFTEVIECLTAYILGVRRRDYYIAIVAINAITNPLLNYLLALLLFAGIHVVLLWELALEALVVFSEWRMLSYVFPKDKRLFRLALIMNAASYLIGKLIL